jgi:hypothetical protein
MAETRDWNFLRRKALPELPENPTYKQVLEAVRVRFRGQGLDVIALELQKYDDLLAKVEEQKAGINAFIEGLESIVARVLEERFDSGSEDPETTVLGMFFKLERKNEGRVDDETAGAKKLFVAWMKETGREELLSVHAGTLKKIVREHTEDGEEPPPGTKLVPVEKLTRKGRASRS